MKRLAWLAAISLVAACGGSDDNGGADPDASVDVDAEPQADADEGEVNPISNVTTAYERDEDGAFQEVGPANWDCLGEPDNVAPTENDIVLSGDISEFMDNGIEQYSITAFDGLDFSGEPTAGPVECIPDEEEEESCDPTVYEGLTLPAGVTYVAFRVATQNDLTTYSLFQTFDPEATEATRDFRIVGDITADILAAAALGRSRTAGRGIVAGDVLDCDGNLVRHVIAAISTTSGELDPPAEVERTYYFGGLTPRAANSETQRDGRFMIPELQPSETPIYVQVWGYPDQAAFDAEELALLSELEVAIPADGLITTPFAPLRAAAENGGDEE